jgi:hypothetical protein
MYKPNQMLSGGVRGACLVPACLVLSLTLAACAGPAATGNAAVTFPTTTKTTFGRTSCSPALDSHAAQGLVVAMPSQITWGEPLPICGYLRIGEELRISQPRFDFILERKDRSLDQYRGNGTQELGDPQMDKQSPAYDILQKEGELYFSVDGQHPFRDLSPGEYEIEITYLDQLRTERKPLKVIAGGWRKDLSDALVVSICEGNLLSDLSEYVSLVRMAARGDAAPGGVGQMERQQEAAWRTGFARHTDVLTPGIRSRLASISNVDASIPLHVYQTGRARCPSKPIEPASMLDLFGGLRRYEAAATEAR